MEAIVIYGVLVFSNSIGIIKDDMDIKYIIGETL